MHRLNEKFIKICDTNITEQDLSILTSFLNKISVEYKDHYKTLITLEIACLMAVIPMFIVLTTEYNLTISYSWWPFFILLFAICIIFSIVYYIHYKMILEKCFGVLNNANKFEDVYTNINTYKLTNERSSQDNIQFIGEDENHTMIAFKRKQKDLFYDDLLIGKVYRFYRIKEDLVLCIKMVD